jgi:microcystin-dependent protein
VEVYLGTIYLFAGNFAPLNFAFCDGRLLSIQQYPALFSLLGDNYGGNGQTTFGLPDLRGRGPISFGQGPGLANFSQGDTGGTENATLLASNVPSHAHDLTGDGTAGTQQSPGGKVLGACVSAANGIYSNNAPNVAMKPTSVAQAGGNVPVSLQQPYLALNYIIALQGLFPSRN